MLCIFIINIFILITAEKIAVIKKKTKNGYPVGKLKNELINEGYTKEDIAKCFEVHKADMRSWYLVFGIVFSFLSIWYFFEYGRIILVGLPVIMFSLYYQSNKKELRKNV
jgi:hypothetical protein